MPTWTKEQLDAYQARRLLPHPKQLERSPELGAGDEGKAQGSGCVPVRFTLFRTKLLDVDAKYSSVKDLLDCIVDAGLADGDKEGQIDLQVHQVKVKTRAEERTEIEIGTEESPPNRAPA